MPPYDLPVQPGADHGGDQADRSPLGLNQWRHNGSLRKGHDGLAALVKNELHKDPFTGTVFVFRSRRADRLKLLYWDGTGLVMAYKRLEEHTFTWPAIKDGVMSLGHAQFEALFVVSKTRLRHDGLDWRRVRTVEARAPMAVE